MKIDLVGPRQRGLAMGWGRKNLITDAGTLQLAAAGVAAVLALSTYLIGVRRQRILAHRPLPDRISPRRQVNLTGGSIIALILISTVSLMV